MSLISCPECNKQISDQAHSCPSCGFPLDKIEKNADVKKLDSEAHSIPRENWGVVATAKLEEAESHQKVGNRKIASNLYIDIIEKYPGSPEAEKAKIALVHPEIKETAAREITIRNQKQKKLSVKEGMQLCPFCKEGIKEDAVLCRYCTRDLNENMPSSTQKQVGVGVGSGIKIGIGIGILIAIVIVFAVLLLVGVVYIER